MIRDHMTIYCNLCDLEVIQDRQMCEAHPDCMINIESASVYFSIWRSQSNSHSAICTSSRLNGERQRLEVNYTFMKCMQRLSLF